MLSFYEYCTLREARITDPFGQDVEFAQRYPNDDYEIVVIDPQKMLPYWKMNSSNYVEPGSENEIGGRIKGFGTWYQGDQHYHRLDKAVEPSKVHFNYPKEMRDKYPDNPRVWSVGFSDGRHRFTWMINQGFKQIPIQTEKADAEDFKRMFG